MLQKSCFLALLLQWKTQLKKLGTKVTSDRALFRLARISHYLSKSPRAFKRSHDLILSTFDDQVVDFREII